jgi:SAM-dependent methyltransferase
MNIKMLFARAVDKARRHGIRGVLSATRGHLRREDTEDAFDATYGTDTSGKVPLWKLQIPSSNARHGLHYAPSGEKDLLDAVESLHEDLQTFTFVDLGCGKGRALLIASKLGFKQVIGIEFASELVNIARANLTKLKNASAVVIHADASDFKFPDGNLMAYFFNPFREEVMRKVVANLRECSSGKRYVIYANPMCAEVIDTSGFLSRIECPPSGQIPKLIWKATN